MKTFNFRKLGILLVMMLVAGFALAGPVSALDVYGSISKESTYIHYAGTAATYPETADYIEVTVELKRNGITIQSPATSSRSQATFVSASKNYGGPFSSGTYSNLITGESENPSGSGSAFYTLVI